MCQYAVKMSNFEFFDPILKKMDLGLEIEKINVRIRISILEIAKKAKNFFD